MEGNIDKAFLEEENNERLLKRSLIEAHTLFNNIENFGGKINDLTQNKLEKLSQKIDQLVVQCPNYSDELKEINNQVNLFLENKDYLDMEEGSTPGKNIKEFEVLNKKEEQFEEVILKIKNLLNEIESENTDIRKSA